MSDDLAKRALANAAEGQALTNAWHDRMREADRKAPKGRLAADDDPKRGCMSPLGGGWTWKDPRSAT